MRIFFDTSALVKRYVEENGSDQVQTLCDQAESIVLSIICLPELISALCRLRRETSVTLEDYQYIRQMIVMDVADMDICPMTPEVMRHTLRCLETHSLRAMDAIHLGCALASAPERFVSADQRQLQAARAEGLNVIEVAVS